MRLALADYPGETESAQLLHKSAPWSARLAARLLREHAAGSESAWQPYLAVLPRRVETPVLWSWDLIAQVRRWYCSRGRLVPGSLQRLWWAGCAMRTTSF